MQSYINTNCLFGRIFSMRLVFFNRNDNFAGLGLFAKMFAIPAGNDTIISPNILTWHLKKYFNNKLY